MSEPCVAHDRMTARQRIVCRNRMGFGLSAVGFETRGSSRYSPDGSSQLPTMVAQWASDRDFAGHQFAKRQQMAPPRLPGDKRRQLRDTDGRPNQHQVVDPPSVIRLQVVQNPVNRQRASHRITDNIEWFRADHFILGILRQLLV